MSLAFGAPHCQISTKYCGYQFAEEKREKDFPLFDKFWQKLCRLGYNGEKQEFSMEVVGSFHSCLERQINEAVRITSTQAEFYYEQQIWIPPGFNCQSCGHQWPPNRARRRPGLGGSRGQRRWRSEDCWQGDELKPIVFTFTFLCFEICMFSISWCLITERARVRNMSQNTLRGP